MKTNFEFHPRKVWEFIESRPFYNSEFYPQWNTSMEIYEKYIENDPKILEKYTEFDWSGIEEPHQNEEEVLKRRESYHRLSEKEEVGIPTFYDIKYAQSSKIFEAEDVRGSNPEQLQNAEEIYEKIIEQLNNGEDLDEGILSGLAGGAIGALAGPAIGKAICKVLGVEEKGNLGRLLTSRLVTTALGYAIGKGK